MIHIWTKQVFSLIVINWTSQVTEQSYNIPLGSYIRVNLYYAEKVVFDSLGFAMLFDTSGFCVALTWKVGELSWEMQITEELCVSQYANMSIYSYTCIGLNLEGWVE